MKALAAALASLWPLAALACADGGYQELDHRHRTPGDALRDMRRGEAKVCAVVDVRAPRRAGEEADFWFVRHMRDRRDGGIALDRLPHAARRDLLEFCGERKCRVTVHGRLDGRAPGLVILAERLEYTW